MLDEYISHILGQDLWIPLVGCCFMLPVNHVNPLVTCNDGNDGNDGKAKAWRLFQWRSPEKIKTPKLPIDRRSQHVAHWFSSGTLKYPLCNCSNLFDFSSKTTDLHHLVSFHHNYTASCGPSSAASVGQALRLCGFPKSHGPGLLQSPGHLQAWGKGLLILEMDPICFSI